MERDPRATFSGDRASVRTVRGSRSALVRGFARMASVARHLATPRETSPPRAVSRRYAPGQLERARLQLALERGPSPVLLVDPTGVITAANSVARDLFGARANVGAPALEVIAPTFRERIARHLGAAESHVDVVRLVDDIEEKERTGALHVAPLDEERTAWTFLHADPSTLRALRDKEDLLQSERARAASFETQNRAMNRLLAIVAHDLRGPTSAIMGWTQLLHEQHFDRAGRERGLDVIERNARAQVALIDELLDLARVHEGKLGVSLQRLDLALLAKQCIETARPPAEAAGLTLELDAPAPAWVIGDGRRLAQVVMNFLDNAIKFTPREGRITVTVARSAAVVRLSVRDTGRGIPADLLPRVFDWAAQGDIRGSRGLGLGLFIVRELVKVHGGSVHAASDGHGKGSVFTVELPAAVRDDDERDHVVAGGTSDHAPHVPVAPQRAVLSGRSVLLVSDDDERADLAATILRARGAQLSHAAAHRHVEALASRMRPDVVIFDVDDESVEDWVSALSAVDATVPTVTVRERRADFSSNAAGSANRIIVTRPIHPAALVEAVARACTAPEPVSQRCPIASPPDEEDAATEEHQ